MSQPPSFTITVLFQQEEQNQVSGRGSVRTAALDTMFANIQTTLAAVLTNLFAIQRDDLELRDGIVEIHALSADVLALIANEAFVVRGAWATATAYVVGDIVARSGTAYICIAAHTSNDFATDLATPNWVPLASPIAAQVPFSPTSTISATDAQGAIEELDTDFRPALNVYLRTAFGGL